MDRNYSNVKIFNSNNDEEMDWELIHCNWEYVYSENDIEYEEFIFNLPPEIEFKEKNSRKCNLLMAEVYDYIPHIPLIVNNSVEDLVAEFIPETKYIYYLKKTEVENGVIYELKQADTINKIVRVVDSYTTQNTLRPASIVLLLPYTESDLLIYNWFTKDPEYNEDLELRENENQFLKGRIRSEIDNRLILDSECDVLFDFDTLGKVHPVFDITTDGENIVLSCGDKGLFTSDLDNNTKFIELPPSVIPFGVEFESNDRISFCDIGEDDIRIHIASINIEGNEFRKEKQPSCYLGF